MSSLVDEFQAGLKISEKEKQKGIIGTSLFRNLKILEDTPIFSKNRINFVPASSLTHMIVRSNHLVLAMANMTLMKIDLTNPEDVVEIDLRKFTSGGKVYKLFMDIYGHHILVSIVQNGITAVDVLYLPWKSIKPRVCSKLKNVFLTSVGFCNSQVTDQTTGPLLLGCSEGTLYEMELLSDVKLMQNGFEKYIKQVFVINRSQENFITDLEVVQSTLDKSSHAIFCSNPREMFIFTGYLSLGERPLYPSIFGNYGDDISPYLQNLNYVAMKPMLQLLYSPRTNAYDSFTWLTEEYIWTGDIDFKNMKDSSKVEHVTYSKSIDESDSPLGFVITKYHIAFAWTHKIGIYCLLNAQVVLIDKVPDSSGNIVGITADSKTQNIWAFAEKAVFKYKVEREDRNIWRVHLQNRKYDLARTMCGKEEHLQSFILRTEAEDLYNDGHYEKSAEIFAKVKASFEDISLKFTKKEKALKIFLENKLLYLTPAENTQISLVVLWLMELYLKELGALRDANKRNTPEYGELNSAFKSFRDNSKVRGVINENSNAVYNLHSAHDDQDNYVAVAVIMKDFNRVILHLISHQRHLEALQIMKTQGSVKLFYQHTSALLQVIPNEVIDALVSLGHQVDPSTLLPILVHSHASCGHSEQVLRYVEFCVEKLDVTDKVMHNFMITLCCLHAPEKLLPYLKLQGDDSNFVSYDVKFALRECMTAGHDEACIHILTTMNLYKDAVELALKTDINLAKAVANRTKFDEALCKELWLLIASHIIDNESDVGTAMELLKECSLIKIEDILPFFPDFVTIDKFKDTICTSLEQYNEQINELKTDMEEATKIASDIRSNIKKFKQKKCTFKSDDNCSECNYPLLTRSFYLFNCGHKFHQDCLSDAIMSYLPQDEQKQLSELRGKLIATSHGDRLPGNVEREEIRQKIDSIIATECLHCGELAIDNIDTPFIPDDEWNATMASWE